MKSFLAKCNQVAWFTSAVQKPGNSSTVRRPLPMASRLSRRSPNISEIRAKQQRATSRTFVLNLRAIQAVAGKVRPDLAHNGRGHNFPHRPAILLWARGDMENGLA